MNAAEFEQYLARENQRLRTLLKYVMYQYMQQVGRKPASVQIVEREFPQLAQPEPSPPSAVNTKWEGPQGHNAMCGFVTGGECDCGWSAYCDRLISSAELKKLKLAALGDGGESAEQEQNKAGAASSGAGFNAPPLSNEPSPVEPSTPSAAPDWTEQCAHEIRVWLYGDVRSEDFNVHTEKQVAALIWQRAERVAPEPAPTEEKP